MNLTSFKTGLVRAASVGVLKVKGAAPALLIGGGIVALIGAGVVACRATLKVESIVDEHTERMTKVRDSLETKAICADGSVYSEDDAKKDTRTIYIQTAFKLAKLYTPAALIALLGVASILCGHRILNARFLSAAATATGLQKTIEEYRHRVADEYGVEKENLLWTGGKLEDVVAATIDPETGEIKETKTKEIVANKHIGVNDPMCFIFDIANAPHTWSHAPGYNISFLLAQQNMANERLQSKGYLTVNQVLESLGMEATNEGMVNGWIYDKNADEPQTVSFGLFRGSEDNDIGCFSGGSPDYILRFNATTNLYGKLPNKKKPRPRKGAIIK